MTDFNYKLGGGDCFETLHITEANQNIQRQKKDYVLQYDSKIFISDRPLQSVKRRMTAISGHSKFWKQDTKIEYPYDPTKSPYYLNHDDENKYFMSGYQGFIPGQRFLLGATKPILSHDAINNFAQSQQHYRNSLKRPYQLSLDGKSLLKSETFEPQESNRRLARHRTTVYPVDDGMVPKYAGHIPGHKFRFGGTFGDITRDPRHLSSKMSN